MSQAKLQLDELFAAPDAVAAVAPTDAVFGLLKRTVDLPPYWAVLVTRRQGDFRMTRPGGHLKDDDAREVMFVRTSPINLSYEETGIAASDGYLCKGSVRLNVAAIPELSELRSFRKELVGSSGRVRESDVSERMAWAVRDALSAFAGERPADVLVDGDEHDEFNNLLGEKLQPICFELGLRLDESISVSFESVALQRTRAEVQDTTARVEAEKVRQQLQSARREARQEHLHHLTGLLDQLENLGRHSPEGSLQDLIKTFSESDRGELYGVLWRNSPVETKTQWVVCATGNELLYFDPVSPADPGRRVVLESEAGSLRSMSLDFDADRRPLLLAGAATGVHVLDAREGRAHLPDQGVRCFEGGEKLRGGINAACLLGDELLATHSEVGVIQWKLQDSSPGRVLLADMTAGARTVRCIRRFCDRVWLAVDDHVISLPVDQISKNAATRYTGSGSTITAVFPSSGCVYAGNAAGQVLRWDTSQPEKPEVLHGGNGRAAETVVLLNDGGIERMFYTDTSLALYARVVGDAYACRYEAGGQTIRRAEVSADLIVAINDPRDQMIFWNPNQPGEPAAIIPVMRISRHSVQDVCLVPSA